MLATGSLLKELLNGRIELNENQNKSTARSKEFCKNGMLAFSTHENYKNNTHTQIEKTNKNDIPSK